LRISSKIESTGFINVIFRVFTKTTVLKNPTELNICFKKSDLLKRVWTGKVYGSKMPIPSASSYSIPKDVMSSPSSNPIEKRLVGPLSGS
jgi:hypothetical protein